MEMGTVNDVPAPEHISVNDLHKIGLFLARSFTLICSGAGTLLSTPVMLYINYIMTCQSKGILELKAVIRDSRATYR